MDQRSGMGLVHEPDLVGRVEPLARSCMDSVGWVDPHVWSNAWRGQLWTYPAHQIQPQIDEACLCNSTHRAMPSSLQSSPRVWKFGSREVVAVLIAPTIEAVAIKTATAPPQQHFWTLREFCKLEYTDQRLNTPAIIYTVLWLVLNVNSSYFIQIFIIIILFSLWIP